MGVCIEPDRMRKIMVQISIDSILTALFAQKQRIIACGLPTMIVVDPKKGTIEQKFASNYTEALDEIDRRARERIRNLKFHYGVEDETVSV